MDRVEVQPKSDINILRRQMISKFTLDVKAGQTVTVTPRTVQITGEKQKETVTLEVWGKEYDCKEELIVVKTKRNG